MISHCILLTQGGFVWPQRLCCCGLTNFLYEFQFVGTLKGLGESDQWGYKSLARRNPTQCYDVHATILHQLGIDHERLTF